MTTAMEIFTSAPRGLDFPDSREVGELGGLRIVSVGGKLTAALDQLNRYRDQGFFASVHRSDALEFVVEKGTLEREIDAAINKKRKAKDSGDRD